MTLPQNRKDIPQASIVCGIFNTEFKSPALQCQSCTVCYFSSPPSIPPLLTLPPHQLITTPHSLRNISPPIRLPFHCTLIPHHSIRSLIQPAHPQLLLNPFIHLKHLHSHPKHTILLFPASSFTSIPHPTPQYPGWVPVNDIKGHNCE